MSDVIMTPSLSIVFCRGSRITWNRPCRWKKCLSAQVTPSGTCNVCLRKTGHSLGQYIRSRKLTEIAQKLKQSNEPILYLAERYGFESQQTLTRTFKNYFDVPPHKYRITNVPGESRYLHPLNNCC